MCVFIGLSSVSSEGGGRKTGRSRELGGVDWFRRFSESPGASGCDARIGKGANVCTFDQRSSKMRVNVAPIVFSPRPPPPLSSPLITRYSHISADRCLITLAQPNVLISHRSISQASPAASYSRAPTKLERFVFSFLLFLFPPPLLPLSLFR